MKLPKGIEDRIRDIAREEAEKVGKEVSIIVCSNCGAPLVNKTQCWDCGEKF